MGGGRRRKGGDLSINQPADEEGWKREGREATGEGIGGDCAIGGTGWKVEGLVRSRGNARGGREGGDKPFASRPGLWAKPPSYRCKQELLRHQSSSLR